MRYGVKAALNDAREMASLDVELLEVHLGPEDLARYRDSLVQTFREVRAEFGHDMVVHAPEVMPSPGWPILVDLASPDERTREMSSASLDAAIGFAQEIEAILMVTHPGGILPSSDDPEARDGIERLIGSLVHVREEARAAGIALTLENMPWFYHVGPSKEGQRERWESTILVDPEDMALLSESVDGLTLDVSHGYLYDPQGGMEIIRGFIEYYQDLVMHLHLSDALPPDHEGLQVGQGGVDFEEVLRAFRGRAVTAVPEIMGGHRAGGLSFKRALEELRRIEAGL